MHRGRGTDHGAVRVRHHRPPLLACLLALLAAATVLVAGCGGQSAEEKAAERARAVAHARKMAVGGQLFVKNCGNCHTIAGRRYTGPIIEFEAPNLDEVRLKRSYVEFRLQYGGPAMPGGFERAFSEYKYRALRDYIVETAGGNVDDDGDQPADELAAGREVFAEHCAGCHAIAGRAASDEPVYIGTDFTLAKPSERFVIDRMEEGLPGMMPSFRGKLTDAEFRAVATYVTAVAGEGPVAPQPR